MKFKSAILRQNGKLLSVEEIELRDKLKPGQVLVKLHKTAICGSQIGEIDGIKGPDPYLPHLLGHEAIGQVVDNGDSTKCNNGDFVVLHWIKCDGREAPTPKYYSGSEVINAGQIATFSEYAVISENRLTVIENYDALSKNIFSILGCALLTAYGTLFRVVKQENLGKTLILGGGGLGQALILLLSEIKRSEIFLVEPIESRAEYCKRLGSITTFASLNEAKLLKPYSAAIDTTGIPSVIESSYDLLDRNSVLALLGVTKNGLKINLDPMPLHYGRQVVGIFGGSARPKEDLVTLIATLANSPSTSSLLFNEYQLENINTAISSIRLGELVGRAIINLELERTA